MKNLLTLSLALFVFAMNTKATTYYVSPGGSDSNPGTINSPFKSWQKLSSVLKAGDTGYIRGGTYKSPLSPGASDWIVTWANLAGTSSNHIVISAYPGEQPILDLAGFDQSKNTTAVRVNKCSWVEFIGLWVWNLAQHPGYAAAGWEFHECTDITMNRCWVHNIGGAGIRQGQPNGLDVIRNDRFTYINCDASWCADPISTGGGDYGNADGFDCNEGTATYIGCRAWWNSDDGFDCFYNDKHIYYKNCWSFRNGYVPGTYNNPGSQADGMGFKWGMTTTDQSANILRTYTNCIAFDNKSWGFDQNVAKCKAEFYNNTSYRNKAGGWATGYSITPREQSILRNNICFSDPVAVSDMSGLANDHNTWNSLAASTASFASLDTSGVTRPRQLDASLPNIQFLHLSPGSNMINAGISITGINQSFTGSAPDLGAFEYADQPPVANAGSDQIFSLPTVSTTLTGSGTDADGTITGYQWTKISGPSQVTITSPTLAKTNVSNLIEGQYQFELKVTDNSGATGRDTVTVTVNQSSNQPPIAKAGNSQSITLPINAVSLDGSGSSDPDGSIASYQWTKVLGPSSVVIVNPNQATTDITSLVQGIYQFELKVTDNLGAVGKDTVQVTVGAAPNQAPIANAGLDISTTLPTNSVTLSGSGADLDGTIASYQWSKISGPSQYSISSPSQSTTSVSNLVEGTYQFQLTVTDNSGASDVDIVQITVNPAPNQSPTADAGLDINITLPTNSVTLSGSGTDADGTISSYQWSEVAGPSQSTILSAGKSSTSVNNLIEGIYNFELTVTDDLGATSVDFVQVTVNPAPNQPPTANAGLDINITLPTNSTILSGSGVDPDGSIMQYQWSKISGPAQYTISSTTTATTSIGNLAEGIYEFQLQVTDNSGAVATDIVTVTVNGAAPQPNQNPDANAGSDLSITLPTNNTTLAGSGSDPDGTITSYQWTMISGPAQYNITSPTEARTSVSNLTEGVYEFQLEVKDNAGATNVDVVQVTVDAAPVSNQPPSANAGSDIVITLPTNNTTLSGSATDPDGWVVSYQWRKISGPSQYNITSPNTAQTSVSNLAQGVYAFELTATDNTGSTAKDTVQITVNAAPNQLPTAYAGADINITLPSNSVALSGTGTDPDGTIVSYRWTKVAGPSQYSLTSSTVAKPTVSNLVQGSYSFELTVTDNSGASAKDTVFVTVNAAVAKPNQIPEAYAGSDVQITLPTNSTRLSGKGTDPDGTISSYRWRRILGPEQFYINSPTRSSTTVSNLVKGTYSFELTVTDNLGATDKDTVLITVLAAPVNQAPKANAGPDVNITLPTDYTTLSGNGSDPDGTISSYKWAKISGPSQYSIGSSTKAQTSVTNLTQGVYQFELTVTDNAGATNVDVVQVTVDAAPIPNQSPSANAGSDIVITLPTNNTTLSGSATDPDGWVVSYQWRKISGPSQYNITSPNTAQTSVSNLAQGVYAFELTATDNTGSAAKDTVQVTVNAAPNQLPTAYAGADVNITLPSNSVALSGTGTDPDGTIVSYRWTKVAGPSQYSLTSTTVANPTVSNLVQGSYSFELTVTDNSGASAKDTVFVTVNAAVAKPNQIPEASAGSDVQITLPTNSTRLSGKGTDPDGTISSYRWRRVLGPEQFYINSPTRSSTTVSNLVKGTYSFELTVTDNLGATDKDTVLITVLEAPVNQAPKANAGADVNITLPTNSTSLSGSGSDPDGTISSYKWAKISGPSQYSIGSSTKPQTSVTNLAQGVYQFELTVIDNAGKTGKDTIQVTVNAAPAAPNQAPTANAGADVNITLPTNSTSLSGSGSDPDGTISSYKWAKISGPSQYSIGSSTMPQTSVTNLAQGVYQFELTVIDNAGKTGKDTIQVTVNAAPAAPNQAPTANAGADVNITLPTNSTSLSGSGSDADGTISSYKWAKIFGPSQYSIGSSTMPQISVTNLAQGVYQFELTVIDNAGKTGKDTMQVTVNAAPAAPNQAPTANAGADVKITLPTNSTSLSGSGSDPDGTISSYKWAKISGPSQYSIGSSTMPQTSVTNLAQGVYQFELTVIDNAGKTGKDTMQVTVNAAPAAPNQAPTANAGLDVNITLPTNDVILSGSGTDPDGTITLYKWNKISGPSDYNIVSASQAQTTVDSLAEGTYQFELTVTDNAGKTAKDTVQVTVNPTSLSANHVPTADAGTNVDITLPTNSVKLTGKGKDVDGTVTSYKWKKSSGPAEYNIASSNTAETEVTGLVQGVYTFELTVTDNSNAAGRSTMQVTVHEAPNQLPTADAGSDVQISLPTDTATLTGAGSDPDGTIASYKWTKIAGPGQSSVVSPLKSQTLINNLTEGVYQFELTVTDNDGAASQDTVEVIVLAVPKAFAKLFPNPATSTINIQIEGAGRTSNTALRIYDNKGILVYQEDFVRPPQPMIKQVNVSRLPGGIYFVELQTDTNNISTLRFMKK